MVPVKRCSICGGVKFDSEFYEASHHKDGLASACKVCCRLRAKASYLRFGKEYHNYKNNRWRARVRSEVLTHYGNGRLACICCGFDDVRALTIDHIYGGGRAELQKLNRHPGIDFYSYLRQQSYPEGYQTLCQNCQSIKRVEDNNWRVE